MKMIITSECEGCRYGSVDERNPRKVLVYCKKRKRGYFYGQCIACDDFKKRKEIDCDCLVN